MTPYDALFSAAMAPVGLAAPEPLNDPFHRRIEYVRVSVTDRCDLRCAYCMPERMSFLPRRDLLSIEELDRLGSVFVGLGVRKLRLTGGEPLLRKGFMDLVQRLSRHLHSGALRELTLTTNGTRLGAFAPDLKALGVKRVNVSLDTLDAARFRSLTRGGDLMAVLDGLKAAKAAGLQVKINTVALKHDNLDEIPSLLAWAHGEGFGLTLIETMPLGDIDVDRTDQFVSLAEVRDRLAAVWTLTPEAHQTGGPARYDHVAETGGQVGFITPLSHSFCDSCNRVRVTCTGTLHTCLGQDDATELRETLRAFVDDGPLRDAIRRGVAAKPRKHDFVIGNGAKPAVARHMSTTGGGGMRILLFGPLRDLAGWREQIWDVVPVDLAAVKAELARTDPRLGDALARPSVQVAVDKVVVRDNPILHAAAEVAFLAPMSGG